jgi:hypothetical protein
VEPGVPAFVGSSIVGEKGGEEDGVAVGAEAGMFREKFIAGPICLAREDPVKGEAVIIEADDEGDLAAPAPRLLQGNNRFVKPVVHLAVLADRERVLITAFPVNGVEHMEVRAQYR